MAPHDSEGDTPPLSEYRDKFSGWRVYFLYLTIIVYGLTFSTTTFLLHGTSLPWEIVTIVMLAALGCALLCPVVLFIDIPHMRENSVWNPALYRYVFGSTLVGLPGIFVIMFYIKLRRDAVKQTYNARIQGWEQPDDATGGGS